MGRKQLNIRLDEKIHKRAKIAAILKGETLNSYIEKAILDALEKDDNKDKIDNIENEN
ncbi:MAG: HicB family [Candidatus Woesearchaeota archaeon]|nr:HicB family [Candidatus Woesearchaeota archaeon]